jgi:hypothetical protein
MEEWSSGAMVGEGHFGMIYAPKVAIGLSPGFQPVSTLGSSPAGISPEGATRHGEKRLRTLPTDRVAFSSPFRAKHVLLANPG